jgi:hypothetical protein
MYSLCCNNLVFYKLWTVWRRSATLINGEEKIIKMGSGPVVIENGRNVSKKNANAITLNLTAIYCTCLSSHGGRLRETALKRRHRPK